MVHLKCSTTKQYDNLLEDLDNAKQIKLKERPHHFAYLKKDEVLVVDIWESAEDYKIWWNYGAFSKETWYYCRSRIVSAVQ